MFDKTIKIKIDGKDCILTNEQVRRLVVNQQAAGELRAIRDENRRLAESLQQRLAAANAQLKLYGHLSEF